MINIGIVVSNYNNEVTSLMKKVAVNYAKIKGSEVVAILEVPGVLDLPLPTKKLLKKKHIDAIVVLGFAKHGQTDHDQLVTHQSVRALIDLSISFNKPIGFGIIGPRASLLQGKQRAKDYAQHAVDTAIALVRVLS